LPNLGLLARLRAYPAWAFLIVAAGFAATALFTLGVFYPPGPLGQIPYGPVSLSVAFPSRAIAGREPILSGGVKGTTYILSVEAAGPGMVHFVYEAWGAAEQVSAPAMVVPGPWYALTIDMPQLRAPTDERGVPLRIVLNGNQLMRQEVPYSQLAVKSLWIGSNPLNGPYLGRDPFPGPPRPYAFSGRIRDIQRLPTNSSRSSFLADRLFPNLRYEVEVTPHIFYWSILIGALTGFTTIFFFLESGLPRHEFVRRLRYVLTPVAITALPLLPLLQISRTYRADWLNHGWIMEYYGQFLLAHHWLPHIVNSRQLAGMPSPLFYGHLLYSIGGFFSALLGGDIGIRLILFMALLCQTLCVRRTVWRLTGSLTIADVAAAIVCWAIYPFSNLYGGSVMEFMAVCFLNCCICIFIDFCRQSSDRVSEFRMPWLGIVEFSLCFVLTANHPITGLFGGLILALMAAAAMAFSARRIQIAKPLLAASLLSLLLLAPWIYMYAKYGNEIYIGRVTVNDKVEFHEFDTLRARFVPFAYDAKSIDIGALSETSYADMQLNLPLLLSALAGVFFAGTFARRKPRGNPGEELPAKALIWLGWCVFSWALLASVYPAVAELSPSLTHRLRYAFRLINFQNLGILLVTLAWCWLYRLRGTPRRGVRYRVWLPAFCSALLSVGAVSMLEKWTHGSAATEQSAIGHSPQRALTLPYTFYWVMDYVGSAPDISGSSEARQAISFNVSEGDRFGDVEPVSVNSPDKKWIVLDVTPLPVNRIYIDGARVADKDIYRVGHQAAVQVGGGTHRIEYRFEPGATWTVLRVFTEALFFSLILVIFIMEIMKMSAVKAVPHPSRSFADRRSPVYTS
jgi:hypothetical protein